MKKRLFILALSATFCFGAAAQNNELVELVDTLASQEMPDIQIPQNSMLGMVQGFASLPVSAGPANETVYPLGRGLFKKHRIEQAIEICPTLSKSKVSQSELLSNSHAEEINDTGYGLNFGYTAIFCPGHEEEGKLHLNKAGFTYNIGFVSSFSVSDRYGTLCDFLGKVGLEICHNYRLSVGVDFLAGYGKSAGDLFFYKETILASDGPSLISPYTLWGVRYGGQVWLKTGSLGNSSFLSHTDVILFARLIEAPNPGEIKPASLYSFNLWREENWSFGVILRYRM